MLSILLLLSVVAPQDAAPAGPPMIPAFFTAQVLYDICSRPNHGQCSMYVAGVIDGVFLTESRISDPTLCRASITNQRAAELVTDYLGAHPERRAESAASAVKAAVSGVLSCATPVAPTVVG